MDEYKFSYKPNNDDSQIIAVEGNKKPKYIYLNKDDKSEDEIKSNIVDTLYEFIDSRRNYRVSQSQMDELEQAVLTGEEPYNKRLKDIYNEFLHTLKQSHEIKVDDELNIYPLQIDETKHREVLLIVGKSGSGKTHFISNYCTKFNKLYPKSKIYFISSKLLTDEHDFDKVKNINQVDINDDELLEEICNEQNPCEEFVDKYGRPSLVIFDDAVEGISTKKMKYIRQIQDSCLFVGRSKGIFCLISSHIANKGHQSKHELTEMTKIILFINGMVPRSIDYLLSKYVGLESRQINKIINNKEFGISYPWVSINLTHPKYIVRNRSLYFLN